MGNVGHSRGACKLSAGCPVVTIGIIAVVAPVSRADGVICRSVSANGLPVAEHEYHGTIEGERELSHRQLSQMAAAGVADVNGPTDTFHARRLHKETAMLVLSRKQDEKIIIGDSITLMVVSIQGDKVRLGIEAPKEVTIHREEVYEAIKQERSRQSQDSAAGT